MPLLTPEESEKLFNLPTVLTFAATEETEQEGDDDGGAKHRQRNDQGLEVYCIIKMTKSNKKKRKQST